MQYQIFHDGFLWLNTQGRFFLACRRWLMPVLQHVFKMPTATSGLARGSNQWIKTVSKMGRFSYVDCVEFEPLMEQYVKSCLKSGNRYGCPEIKDGEEIPEATKLYHLNPSRKFKPRATTHQKNLPFLRASSFQAAVLGCKNACLYPVKVWSR